MRTASVAFSVLSHIALILELARGEKGGFLFAILCVSKPVFTFVTKRDLWSKSEYSSVQTTYQQLTMDCRVHSIFC